MTKLVRHGNGGLPTVFDEMQSTLQHAFEDSVFGPEFLNKFFAIDFDRKQSYPKTDIIDEDKSIVFEVDIQGLSKEDVSVDLQPSDDRNHSYLVISGGKKEGVSDEKRKYIRKEIKRSSWRRSWLLDESQYDVSKIKADVADGLLVVNVPKLSKEQKQSSIRKIL